MNIKEITVGISITKNLGDYNSARVEHSMTIELDEDDNLEEIRDSIYEDIEAFIEEKLDA